MYSEVFSTTTLWCIIVVLSLNIFFIYYLTHVVKQPRLICAKGPLSDFLQSSIPSLRENYWPTFWCLGSGAQTMLAGTIRRLLLPKIAYRREILALKDGGELALDWLEEGCNVSSPCILLIPGLIGESQTEYIRSLARAANRFGFRVVSYNYRGLGGVQLKTKRLYTLGGYEDLAEVIRHIREQLCEDCKLGCAAVSLGSLMLGGYLANQREEASKYLSAAMMISPPFDVQLAIENMEKPIFNWLFGNAIVVQALNVFKTYSILKNSKIDMDTTLKSKTIKQLATNLFVKTGMFTSFSECCEEAKLQSKLLNITTPLLCLCGADDIFQPKAALPIQIVQKSSRVAVVLTEYGGHIGFLEGCWPFRTMQYMDRIFIEYFTETLYDMNDTFREVKELLSKNLNCEN